MSGLKLLFFGDIFGRPGREALRRELPKLYEQHKPDFVVVNAENIAHGSGVTKNTLNQLEEIGLIDAYTSGDHIWDAPEAKELLKDGSYSLLRPENTEGPGAGHTVITKGAKRLLVLNAMGAILGLEEYNEAYIKFSIANPFTTIDAVLSEYTLDSEEEGKEFVNGIFVDFHTEFTSEKRAMGFHLDGRVSAMLGTHTHVPTNDAHILQQGTAYMTDVGMVGPHHSVIGLSPREILTQYTETEREKADVAENGQAEIGGVVVEISENGLAQSITPIRSIVNLE